MADDPPKLDDLLASIRQRSRVSPLPTPGHEMQVEVAEAPAPEPEPSTVLEADSVEAPMSAYDALRPRERVYVDGLLVGKSQTAAARDAGYTPNNCGQAGWLLMQRDLVRKAYQERRNELGRAAGIEAMQILLALADIAYGRVTVDSDAVRLRALEDLLEYVQQPGTGVDEAKVSEIITRRFNSAKLLRVDKPKPAVTLRAVPR